MSGEFAHKQSCACFRASASLGPYRKAGDCQIRVERVVAILAGRRYGLRIRDAVRHVVGAVGVHVAVRCHCTISGTNSFTSGMEVRSLVRDVSLEDDNACAL